MCVHYGKYKYLKLKTLKVGVTKAQSTLKTKTSFNHRHWKLTKRIFLVVTVARII